MYRDPEIVCPVCGTVYPASVSIRRGSRCFCGCPLSEVPTDLCASKGSLSGLEGLYCSWWPSSGIESPVAWERASYALKGLSAGLSYVGLQADSEQAELLSRVAITRLQRIWDRFSHDLEQAEAGFGRYSLRDRLSGAHRMALRGLRSLGALSLTTHSNSQEV